MRIDKLTVGQNVLLGFVGHTERARFEGIIGEGDKRRAKFISVDPNSGKIYDWEAYRYLGRWAYGTSAQALRLLKVF